MADILIKKEDSRLNTIIFAVGYVIFLSTHLIASNIAFFYMDPKIVYIIGLVFKYARYFAYIVFAVGVARSFFKNHLVLFLVTTVLFLITEFLFSSNITMLLYVPMFACAYTVRAKDIVSISFKCKGIILFITVFLSQIGAIEDHIFMDGGRNRHGLGFTWTTTGHILFLHLLLEYIYLRRERITVMEYVIMELLNVWFYRMTDASMAFYLTTAFIMYFLIVHLEKKSKFKLLKRTGKGFLLVPVFCALLSIWAQYSYDSRNPIWKSVNTFIHGRLKLGYDGIQKYGLTLLGQKMEWLGFSIRGTQGEYNYIDCSYLQLAIEYGILFLLLVLLIYTVLIYRGLYHKDYYLVSILVFLLVFAMTEPRLMNLMYTVFPLLVLSRMEKEKERKENDSSIGIWNYRKPGWSREFSD